MTTDKIIAGVSSDALRNQFGLSFVRDDDGWFWTSTLEELERRLKKGEAVIVNPLSYAKVTHLHFQKCGHVFRWVLATERNRVCGVEGRCRPIKCEEVK